MKRQSILRNVPVGKTFEVWGKKFTVLRQDEGKVFVLAAEFATTMQFREEGKEYKVAPNDFRDSSVKEYLNGEYIDELVAAGADRNEDIFPLTVDLKCTMGQHEYGTDTVQAGLLTLEQYGEFYDIIPLIEDDWWCLATPWKTPSRSPDTNYTSRVWNVNTNGNCNSNYCSSSYGVRPALVLDSSLSVSDDGSVQTNSAPTTPSSITVPTSIMGGSTITVSWGASTDADNNLEGYIAERSTDGGSTWTQIFQGNATSTTNTVAFGTTSVMYRVKAYDSQGEYSGYKTSSQVTVVNNTAPSAPPAITVPTDVKGGGSLVITWSAATDAENNISTYELQRQVDGGSWSTINNKNVLTYTDTITKGWTSVAYRVRACDPYTTSGWTTSATRTVDNNTAPAITCSTASGGNLGTKSSGFSVSYSVSDADGDTVTVTEKMDGTVKRTFTATNGGSNSFAVTGEYFQKLLNGSHTITITATDGKAATTYTLYFTKSVTTAVITLEEPMDADDQISICAITVAGSIPSDAEYKVEVTNNGKDSSPVWEDCTSESKSGRNYLFKNETAANGFAFNFRVTAKRGNSNVGGYITSIQGGFQ